MIFRTKLSILFVFFYSLFKVNSAPVDQCPCLRVPGTNAPCLAYDSRFQAHSLDEAIQFFDDLSLLDESKPAEKLSIPTNAKVLCNTPQCQACQNMLKTRLQSIGLLTSQITPTLDTNQICNKYRFSRPGSDTVHFEELESDSRSSSISSEEIKKKAKDIKEKAKQTAKQAKNSVKDFFHGLFGRKKRFIDDSDEELDEYDKQRLFNRVKRATTDPSIIGTRYYLSCTKKGTGVDGSTSGLLSLCTQCWAWRQLPDNYAPRFINEMVCHSTDTECLSGYATCGTGTRETEVLRNDSGVFKTVTIAAATYCDCQILAGTALTALATGNSQTSPVPGIPAANSQPA